MVDAPEKIWIDQDDCPYFYEESELTEAGSPVTEYIRADLAILSAPAATDTGLETVGVTGIMPGSSGGFTQAVFRADDVPANVKLCLHSQAEELLAAKDADIDRVLADNRRCLVRIAELEADNAAKDARIKAMEEERASLVEKMGMQISAQLARAEKAEAKLAAAEKAAKSVEQWWLSEGMKHFDGAPYCIFATRAVLGGQKRPWEFKDDEHDL